MNNTENKTIDTLDERLEKSSFRRKIFQAGTILKRKWTTFNV